MGERQNKQHDAWSLGLWKGRREKEKEKKMKRCECALVLPGL